VRLSNIHTRPHSPTLRPILEPPGDLAWPPIAGQAVAMRLALHEYTLTQAGLLLPPAARAVYARRGTLLLRGMDFDREVGEDHGALVLGPLAISGEGEAWVFEVSDRSPDRATLILCRRLPLPKDAQFVLRLDRVDFEPGAVTPRHTHAGPGIRRLLQGMTMAEVGAEYRRIGPGEAWWESGVEPVVGRVLAPGTAFIRCMVLPPSLLGQPSFRPWTPTDAARPRQAHSRLFVDSLVETQNP
jgi:quercetin dioxygenase-like cupin family protein